MFKRLKGSIGKNDETKTPNSLPQNRPTWSGFSTISPLNPEMEDSQFCINDDIEETPKNSPARVFVSESTTVDLGKFSQSSSSLVNDHLSFHTDIESASEIDDSVSVVSEYANEITKENLYAAYKKLHGRYHKHKFKYTELSEKFKQTVTIHDKDKITMTKAQDKLLQRIAELKEQCTLEQAAKAHMEDALRNDIEERDHIISTLNTKIDLLRKNSSDECESTLSVELLAKCERLNDELSSTKSECASLENQIELLKKSEEITLLSLAENKMAIHKELETKEDQIKKLEKTINGLQMENQILLKEKASHLSTNSYQININQNVQEEITKQLNELEGEMSSAFEFKENEVKELRNQLKTFEQRCEVQEQKNISMEEVLKNNEKNYKFVISGLEQRINDDKISSSKKIDTFLKEIGEKSLVIKNLTVKLKEMEKLKQDYEKNKNEIHDLKNQIVQTKKLVKENELIRVDEQNRCIEELKLKSEEISHLKDKLKLIQHTFKENEKKNVDLQTRIDEINLKNTSLTESEEELKMKSEEISHLKDELKLLQHTFKENEKKNVDLQTRIDEINLKNTSLTESEKELKMKSEEISHLKDELKLLQHTFKENEKKNVDLQTHIDEINLKNKSLTESEEELQQKSEEISHLKDELKLLQHKFKENEKKNVDLQTHIDEINLKNKSLTESEEELQQKSEEISHLKDKLKLIQHTFKENEKKNLDLQTRIDEINLKNKRLTESEEELKMKLEEISILKDELKLLQHKFKENEKKNLDLQTRIDEINLKNKSLTESEEELKMKSDEISHLKDELKLLQHTFKENEKKNVDLQTRIDEINLKNKNLTESEEELKVTIFNYKKTNDELQDTIKLFHKEKEMIIETMKTKLDENQLEIEKLNNLNKEMLCQLNQDKLIKISEERSIESVIRDYNLLTEENAYLKKERQKMLQTFHDMLKKIKVDFRSLKSFAEQQLTECSLIFIKHIEHLKAEYSSKIKLYYNNMTETKQKLEEIQNAYLILKSDCVQSLDCFKIEIEKYNEGVLILISQNNKELENKKIDLLRLQEEIESYKKSEQRLVKAEVKETIQELQECIEVQKKTYTDLQDEYSNYQVNEKKKWTDKLIETENKWLEKMDNYKKMMDTEHREEVEALTNEWTNEQKHNALTLMTADSKNEESLEKIIQDVETTSQREEALQRQITKLNKELSELKKMYRNEVHNKHRNEEDDDDNDENNKGGCEMEYLRNILYEYMMGKQPMVLAKVLAAIVKFDSNQLSTILQKEEQKVSLLKTLGL